jgi:predicted ATPase
MRETINIRNLGPIREVCIDHIKPLTVFIGESGSGKSTAMKIIALFRWLNKQCNIREYLHLSGINRSPFRFRTESYLSNCGLTDYVTDKTVVEYSVDFGDGSPIFELSLKNKKLDARRAKVSRENISFNKISFISEARGMIPSYLAGNSGQTTKGTQLGFYFDEVLNDFLLATQTNNKLKVPFLAVSFSVEKSGNSAKYYLTPTAGSEENRSYRIECRHGSSGMQNSIPLMLILRHFTAHFDFEKAFSRSVLNYLFYDDKLTQFRPVHNLGALPKTIFVHIEEPELGLFPDAQCELINSLVNDSFIARNNHTNIMLSTHSPYVLNHLNLLIKASAANDTRFTNGAKMDFDNIAAYQFESGGIEDLKHCENNQCFIDTNVLSDTINDTYNRYAELRP